MTYKEKLFKPLVLIIILLAIVILTLNKKIDNCTESLSSSNEDLFWNFIYKINDLEEDLGALLIYNEDLSSRPAVDVISTNAQVSLLSEIPVEPKKLYNFSAYTSLQPLMNILSELTNTLENTSFSHDDREFLKNTKDYLNNVYTIFKKSIGEDFYEEYSDINFYSEEFQTIFFDSLWEYNITNTFASSYDDWTINKSNNITAVPEQDILTKIISSLDKNYINQAILGNTNLFQTSYNNSVLLRNESEECLIYYASHSYENVLLSFNFKYNSSPSEKKSEEELRDICDMYLENMGIKDMYESSTSDYDGFRTSYQKIQGDIEDKTKSLSISLDESGRLSRISLDNMNKLYEDTPLVPKLSKEDIILCINEEYRDDITDILVYNTFNGIIYEVSIDGFKHPVKISGDTGEFIETPL